MSHNTLIMLSAICAMVIGCSTAATHPPLQTVPTVDIKRYMGLWHEICRYPNRFQKNCSSTTARYTLREDGDVDVQNTCLEGGTGGKTNTANGKAWVVDKGSNAKLKVSFFWPFSGDYWIIDLGREYEFAVVGNPSRKYLWVLSRTPKMDPAVVETILEGVERQGYVRSKLIWTEHTE